MALRDPDSKLAIRASHSFNSLSFDPSRVDFFFNTEPAKGAAAPLEKAIQDAYNHSDADLFVVAADDVECVTLGWDRLLLAAADIHWGARVFMADEGRKSGELLCHPVFTRRWIDTLGYAVPPGYSHYYSDTAVERIARLAQALHYIPSFRIRHWVAANDDPEYLAHKRTLMEPDRQHYIATKAEQEEAARKIREANR